MKKAVTILLHNEDGLILGVSRKDDITNFGLPGGKCEDGETPEQAIIRETKEETGLDISDVRPYFTRTDGEYDCITFVGNFSGDINTEEAGLVKWLMWPELEAGKFGDYNKQLHEHYNNTHKYSTGDVLLNPETNEVFMIMMAIQGGDGSEAGYFVRAMYSELGYGFVKKSAIDGVRYKVSKIFGATSALNSVFDEKISIAQFFAISSHFDVNQYYGDNDCFLYSYHLNKVVKVGRRFKHLIPDDAWDNVENGLWLHDIIEDARKTFNDVKKMLSIIPAELSFALANSTGKTRKERADDAYYAKIRRTRYATFIKLCDRIANVEYSMLNGGSMKDKYKEELEVFFRELYSPGEYEEMWEYLNLLINGNDTETGEVVHSDQHSGN